MQAIPPFQPLYLSEYIQYWHASYKEALALKDRDIPEDVLKQRESTIKNHLMQSFNDLRNIIDDDFFEWNQAMCVYICLCQWQMGHKSSTPAMHSFCKTYNLLRPYAERLSQAILLLKHIDDRWSMWDFKDMADVQQYVNLAHRQMAKFIVGAGTIQTMDRWNFIEAINEYTFRLHPKCIFYICSHVCLQLKSLRLGKFLQSIAEPVSFEVEQEDVDHFYNWAEKHCMTYYSIRTFRMRISSFVWLFLHDEATRCYHTYSRAGEVPTVYAHVTGKYPSGFIGNMQHEMLYSEASDLIRNQNILIHDANMLALFEATMKTLYSVDFIKYCFCNEHSIVDFSKKLLQTEHPVVVRAWGKWGVIENKKFYYSKTIVETLLLWLHIVKEKYNCILMKCFNVTNLVNQTTRINKQASLLTQKNETNKEDFYEVCL